MGHLFITINPKVFIGKNFIKEMKKNIKLVKRLPKAKVLFNSLPWRKKRIKRIKRI